MTLMESDLTALAARLGESLRYLGEQVSTAESCTGGGIAEAITRIPGSSGWFEAGYVTYSNRQKTLQLEVPESLFPAVGAVSREVVEAMVRGAQRHSGARFAVAVSGVAWADGERLVSERCQFNGDRDAVRRQTVATALTGLLRMSNGENPG